VLQITLINDTMCFYADSYRWMSPLCWMVHCKMQQVFFPAWVNVD